MTLEDFLYTHQYKRKIAVGHFIFSRDVVVTFVAMLIFTFFIKEGGRFDSLIYVLIIFYAARAYMKTGLTFQDKISMGNGKKNILLYKMISIKKKNFFNKKKRKI